jgi:hypothetical protein
MPSTQSQNSTPHAPSYAFLGTSTSGPLKIPRSLSLKPPVPPNFISSADLGSEHAPFSGHGFWKHRRPSTYTLDPWLSLRLYSPVPSARVHSCFCLHFRQHLDPYCLDPFPSHCPRCPPNFLSIEPPPPNPTFISYSSPPGYGQAERSFQRVRLTLIQKLARFNRTFSCTLAAAQVPRWMRNRICEPWLPC